MLQCDLNKNNNSVNESVPSAYGDAAVWDNGVRVRNYMVYSFAYPKHIKLFDRLYTKDTVLKHFCEFLNKVGFKM